MISCPMSKTALKALQNPKLALSTQAIPVCDPMVQIPSPSIGQNLPYGSAESFPSHGQNLPTNNTYRI